MTEETHNAAMSGPIGIVTAIGVSAVLGWFLILSLLFSIHAPLAHSGGTRVIALAATDLSCSSYDLFHG
jgi:hypothetical protein